MIYNFLWFIGTGSGLVGHGQGEVVLMMGNEYVDMIN